MRIDTYKLIFWDFDGVIKESIDVKTKAFVHLFDGYSLKIKDKVRNHHLANGGMSRFEKIPLYMQWAGYNKTQKRINGYCFQFSQIVIVKIITVPWVSVVKDYLRKYYIFQN